MDDELRGRRGRGWNDLRDLGGGDALGVWSMEVAADAPFDVRCDVGIEERGVASTDAAMEYVDVTGDDGGERDGCGASGDAGGSRKETKEASPSSSLSSTGTPGSRASTQPLG